MSARERQCGMNILRGAPWLFPEFMMLEHLKCENMFGWNALRLATETTGFKKKPVGLKDLS